MENAISDIFRQKYLKIFDWFVCQYYSNCCFIYNTIVAKKKKIIQLEIYLDSDPGARGFLDYDLNDRTRNNGAKLIVKHFNTSVTNTSSCDRIGFPSLFFIFHVKIILTVSCIGREGNLVFLRRWMGRWREGHLRESQFVAGVRLAWYRESSCALRLTPICALACVCPSRRTAIQQTLTHYKASTLSTNIQNSLNFSSCMHKKTLIPLILVEWIQITYIIAINSHNSLQYGKVLL